MIGRPSRYIGVKAIAVTLLAMCATSDQHRIDEGCFNPEDIIQRDVIVVGGGAGGAHAAVLVKDKGKIVAVVEQNDHLVTYPTPDYK